MFKKAQSAELKPPLFMLYDVFMRYFIRHFHYLTVL